MFIYFPQIIVAPPDVYVALRHLPHPATGSSSESVAAGQYADDLIAHLTIDGQGNLSQPPKAFYSSGGRNPRHFSLSRDSKYIAVANQGDDPPASGAGTRAGVAILERQDNGTLIEKTFIEQRGVAFAGWTP